MNHLVSSSSSSSSKNLNKTRTPGHADMGTETETREKNCKKNKCANNDGDTAKSKPFAMCHYCILSGVQLIDAGHAWHCWLLGITSFACLAPRLLCVRLLISPDWLVQQSSNLSLAQWCLNLEPGTTANQRALEVGIPAYPSLLWWY